MAKRLKERRVMGFECLVLADWFWNWGGEADLGDSFFLVTLDSDVVVCHSLVLDFLFLIDNA